MKEKKNEVITFRVEEWVKRGLEEIAEANKWSIAQTVNQFCKFFIINPHPNKIVIKISDLVKITKQLEEEGTNKATQITIDMEINEETEETSKVMEFEVWECGGNGCISGFDQIRELTEEDIQNIP